MKVKKTAHSWLILCCRHISGLTEVRAENICKYRAENGPFKSREDLKKVKLIGGKTFEQCAGFLRIEPTTAEIDNYNLLDSTWIHPESYNLAERIMKKCNVKKQNIGTSAFIDKIKEFLLNNSIEELANEFKQPKERVSSPAILCWIKLNWKISPIERLKVWWRHLVGNYFVITGKT